MRRTLFLPTTLTLAGLAGLTLAGCTVTPIAQSTSTAATPTTTSTSTTSTSTPTSSTAALTATPLPTDWVEALPSTVLSFSGSTASYPMSWDDQTLEPGTYEFWLECAGESLTVTNAASYADALTALDSTGAHEVTCTGTPQKITTFTVTVGGQAFMVRGSAPDGTRFVGAIAGAADSTSAEPSTSGMTTAPASPSSITTMTADASDTSTPTPASTESMTPAPTTAS